MINYPYWSTPLCSNDNCTCTKSYSSMNTSTIIITSWFESFECTKLNTKLGNYSFNPRSPVAHLLALCHPPAYSISKIVRPWVEPTIMSRIHKPLNMKLTSFQPIISLDQLCRHASSARIGVSLRLLQAPAQNGQMITYWWSLGKFSTL